MTTSFFHGVETIELTTGPRPVQVVRSGIIGLIGTAPIQDCKAGEAAAVGRPVLVSNDSDARRLFGPDKAGYTIPAALRAILASGVGPVVVVNTFDPTLVAHQTTGQPDPAKVQAVDIIGAVDAGGVRRGLQSLRDCRSLFGFDARILIAPGFAATQGVATAMLTLADQVRAVALLDAPAGSTVQAVVEGRGPSGTLKLNSGSERAIYCYPHVQALDPVTGGTRLEPLSQWYAGVIAKNDNRRGYWWSPSNVEIPGVMGLERQITASINDPSCETNTLNGSGVVTVFAGYGTGLRVWGNRNAAFPASSRPTSFISIRRTMDVIEDSLELAAAEFIDYPITRGLVDTILETANSFIRTLIGRGALLGGSAYYDPAKNPPAELAAGKLRLGYRVMPPPPAEKIEFEAFVDVNLAKV